VALQISPLFNHNSGCCRQVLALHLNTKLLITAVKLITINANRKRQNLEREREREELLFDCQGKHVWEINRMVMMMMMK